MLQARLWRPSRQPEGRHEAVRNVVLFHVQQVQPQPGVGIQAEAQRGGNAPALVVDVIAPGYVAVLPHHRQPQCRGGAERGIPVEAGTRLAVAAGGDAAGQQAPQVRLLADHIDRAGRRTAAGIGAGRALDHFHLVDVEQVTRNVAEVACAVYEDARRRIEAAHVQRIAGAGVAVFAGIEGAHAGAVAQRVAQGGGALLLQLFLADDLDGLRGVLQGLGELRRDHEARDAMDLDGFQHLGIGGFGGVGGGVGRGMCGRQGQRQPGAQRRAHQVFVRTLDRMFARFDGCHRGGEEQE